MLILETWKFCVALSTLPGFAIFWDSISGTYNKTTPRSFNRLQMHTFRWFYPHTVMPKQLSPLVGCYLYFISLLVQCELPKRYNLSLVNLSMLRYLLIWIIACVENMLTIIANDNKAESVDGCICSFVRFAKLYRNCFWNCLFSTHQPIDGTFRNCSVWVSWTIYGAQKYFWENK